MIMGGLVFALRSTNKWTSGVKGGQMCHLVWVRGCMAPFPIIHGPLHAALCPSGWLRWSSNLLVPSAETWPLAGQLILGLLSHNYFALWAPGPSAVFTITIIHKFVMFWTWQHGQQFFLLGRPCSMAFRRWKYPWFVSCWLKQLL